MPHFNKYEDNGRRLMVEFKCSRCNGVRCEPLEPLDEKAGDHYGSLSSLHLPNGWCELNYTTVFCPTCLKEYKEFFAKGKEPTE